MCTWTLGIAAAGLAASIGGTAYNASQQAGFAAERNRAEQQKQALSQQARDAERVRQAQFEKQSLANFNEELQKQSAGKVQEQIDQGTQQTQDTGTAIAGTTQADTGLLPGQSGGQVSDVFTGDANRQITARMADARSRIIALSKLSGFDRANGYTASTSNLFNADQGQLQANARRSLQMGQIEGQVQAPWVEEPSMALGQGLSGFGNLALGIAGQGKQGLKTIGDAFTTAFSGSP